jgi:uncharacterized protein (DUF2164 family)
VPQFEIDKQVRVELVQSIQRYCKEKLSEPIGSLEAGLLLDYFLEEAGPVIYNQGVSDAQTRVQSKVADVGNELYTDELQYWVRLDGKKRR